MTWRMTCLWVLAAVAAMVSAPVYAQTPPALNEGAVSLTQYRPISGGYPFGMAPGYPTVGRPTGPPIGRPNEPRAYGETYQGTRVNPDRVPPWSPGGQGLH
jgi:hypothetical protein